MKLVSILILLLIWLYTFGFVITMWKEKQKIAAFAVFLSLSAYCCGTVFYHLQIRQTLWLT